MSSKPSNFLQRPSPIIVHKQQNKKIMCFEENLSRQLSNISNEDYHVVKSASIPFVWESQPGTPKVIRFQENSLPPLTPPPSYLQNINKNPLVKSKKNLPKSKFFQTIFTKRSSTGKGYVASPSGPLSFSSSSSSSSLSSSSPRPRSYSVPSSPMVGSTKGGEEEDLYDVSSSNMCFGNARSRGSHSSMFKKVLLGEFM